MVVSAAKLEANRRDAQKSTGPRTQGGKDHSKMNALRHGCRAEALTLRSLDTLFKLRHDAARRLEDRPSSVRGGRLSCSHDRSHRSRRKLHERSHRFLLATCR